MNKTIIAILLFMVLAGCSSMSEKDRARWEAIDEITDVLLGLDEEEKENE